MVSYEWTSLEFCLTSWYLLGTAKARRYTRYINLYLDTVATLNSDN
jgi:hypothetical protein